MRGRRWVKEKKKELKQKLKEATKSEKMEIVKAHLDKVHDSYSEFIGMIPQVEERIKELESELEKTNGIAGTLPKDLKEIMEDKIRMWNIVLKNLNNVKNKPKAMKLFYSKKVTKACSNIVKKYPDE